MPQINSIIPSWADEVQNTQYENELLDATEALRQQLIQLYCKEGSFSSEKVVKKSQELDKYIVKIQKMGKDKKYSI
ncbi:aspartyl-phosphate phosphatase Spo0E family protein [Brevibacillus laterosporus]|uniref:Aspartyl-phosphate phosphatase Spo0E family protein n=1 Tax=Brevibacillus laterosporus TaxID=1465 RepID=A0A518V8U6_BRELA|nr:aspartyl-phosphate phosphatase Spo0E family protein [Brevibacillus laterosporus]